MTELFDEDELVEEETIPVLDNTVAMEDVCTLDARRRLENKLANKRLQSELDDLADYT